MRSYCQRCPIARSLDVIGDRWNLLIVRELLIHERCRYTDLRTGLPGIATNLLADRLRDLEAAGVIAREDAPPPIATTVYVLTERGRALQPVLRELTLWGVPLMGELVEGEFRESWLPLIAGTYLSDHRPNEPGVEVQLDAPGEPAVLMTRRGTVGVRDGLAEHPALTIGGPPLAIAAVLTGQLTIGDARDAGLTWTGDLGALARMRGERLVGVA